jgi:hypothetical protein
MQVTFKNNTWKKGVTVEVETNNQADEALWGLLGRFKERIAFQDSWILDKGDMIMVRYRRDNNPDDPDGTFTKWTRVSMFVGEVELR